MCRKTFRNTSGLVLGLGSPLGGSRSPLRRLLVSREPPHLLPVWWPGSRDVRLQQKRWAWPLAWGLAWRSRVYLGRRVPHPPELRHLQGAVAASGAAASWRPPSPWVSGRLPPTASPETECVATDRVAASASLGVTSA